MKSQSILATVLGVFAIAGSASAGVLTLTATNQGWIIPDGTGSQTGNYLVGNCGADDCGIGEYRNFFAFSISAVPGTITSASLSLNTFGIGLQQAATLTWQVTSIGSTFGFANLGTGTVYGSRDYSSADAFQDRAFDLNQAGLDAISAAAGGTFRLGGRVVSSTAFGASASDQLIFAGSDGAPVQLTINYSDGDAPLTDTPEPRSVLLLTIGLTAFAILCRR